MQYALSEHRLLLSYENNIEVSASTIVVSTPLTNASQGMRT